MAITYTDNGGGAPNGSKLEFTFTFPVIQTEDTKVALNAEVQATTKYTVDLASYPTKITFNSNNIDSTVQESTGAPKTGVLVRVFRQTEVGKSTGDDAPKAVYAAGSSIRAVDLNANTEQALYAIHELQEQPLTDQNIQDGSITSAKIKDGTIANVDVSATAAIDGTKVDPNFGSQNIATTGTVNGVSATELAILDGATVSTDELNILDGVTATKDEINVLDGVTATKDEINILDGVTATKDEINILDGVTATKDEINILDGVTATKDELNYVDGVTSNIQTQLNNKQPLNDRLTTLSGIQSTTASKLADNTGLTADLADLNELDGMAKQTTITNDDTKFPTSGAVIDYVAAQLAPIGGFEVIATDAAFPNTQPASGVVISIADGGGLVVNGSGTSTTGRTVNGTTVTINNFASNFNNSTVDPGVAILVSSTGSNQVYNYHKATLKEADLLSLSGDINDFAERYRVVNSEPTSGNDEGDLIYDKSVDKIKVWDSTTNSFKLVDAIGEFKFLFLCPTGGTGAPTLNGSINTYDLRIGSSSGTLANVQNAAQLIVSIDGVIQKPNTGTSQPSEGFALVDINTIIFGSNLAAGANVFIIQIGAEVGIGVPGDNQVSTAKLQNLSVTTNKIADQAVTLDKLPHGTSSNNGKFLRANSGADPTFETISIPPSVGGSDGVDFNDNVRARFGTGNDLNIYHDGNGSYLLHNGTGFFRIEANGSNNLEIRAKSGENSVLCVPDGEVELYFDGSKKFDTYAGGVEVIGDITVSGTVDGRDVASDGTKLDGIESAATADQTAAEIRTLVENATDSNVFTDADHTKLNGIETSATADQTASEIVALVADQTIAPSTIDMEDNEKIKLGTGDDLEIFHDGSNSRLKDVGTGVLAISGSDVHIQNSNNTQSIAKFLGGTTNSSAELYYNDSKKISTESGGARVHGSVFLDANYNVQILDNSKLVCGSGSDLQIYHDGTDSRITNTTNALYIDSPGVYIRSDGGQEDSIQAIQNGAVNLFYDGSKKLETASHGVEITGKLTFASDGHTQGIELGADADIVFYHDNSDGYLDNNVGDLYLRNDGSSTSEKVRIQAKGGEQSIVATADGSVELYHDNSKKLETTSSGATVTGNLIATGNLSVNDNGHVYVGNSGDLDLYHNGTDSYIKNKTGQLFLMAATSDVGIQIVPNGAVKLRYDDSNKLETLSDGVNVIGTLKVNGSAIASGGLGNVVEDTTPQLGGDLQSNGKDIDFADNDKATFGTGSDLELYHDGTHTRLHNSTGYIQARSAGYAFNNAAGTENCLDIIQNGSVNLYYDGALQCSTNSGGMNWADGKRAYFGNSSDLQIYHDGSNSRIHNTTGELIFRTGSNYVFYNSDGTEKHAKFNQNGSVELYYDNSKTFETLNGGNRFHGYLYAGDNEVLYLGNSNDLRLFHDGTNSYIRNETGELRPQADAIKFRNNANNQTMLNCIAGGEVELFYDNAKKFDTYASGVEVFGNLIATNNIQVNDGKYLYAGNSGDLGVTHSGTHGFINNQTGDLSIQSDGNLKLERKDGGEDYIHCAQDAQVELHYNGSVKFRTQSYGASVGNPVGDTLSGVDTVTQFYAGYDTSASSTFGGVIMGSGSNGNSPFIGASRAGNQTALHLDFKTNASNRMRISSSGNIGAPTGTNIYNASDSRLKKNVTTLDKGLETIKSLRPVSFNWIDGFCDEEKDPLYGFIAQEVETVDSNLIEQFGNGTVTVGDQTIENSLRVNEKFIIPMLVKAVQELSAKVAALEAK